MGKLTSHVLDIAAGKPAVGMRVRLHKTDVAGPQLLADVRTNGDGRMAGVLLDEGGLKVGRYSLCFHIADYFRAQGASLSEPPFLDEVVVQFGIADTAANYHVPLLVTPWSYSTYRGS
jgi:5-hydroxyisourate hydrolase